MCKGTVYHVLLRRFAMADVNDFEVDAAQRKVDADTRARQAAAAAPHHMPDPAIAVSAQPPRHAAQREAEMSRRVEEGQAGLAPNLPTEAEAAAQKAEQERISAQELEKLEQARRDAYNTPEYDANGVLIEKPPYPTTLTQAHTVPIGRRVQANGAQYSVSSGEFHWELRNPKGDVCPLTNATMPGPSFTPDMLGEWVLTVQSDFGPATFVFTVVEDR
jgi:hypothetical protein